MSKHLASRRMIAGVALLSCASLGCGTAEYEKRLSSRSRQLSQESVFRAMHPPVNLAGTPITVRVPNTFEPSPLAAGTDDRRMKPPGVDLDGLKLTYEGLLTDAGGGKMPFYCYLYSWSKSSSAPGGSKGPDRALQNQLQLKFPKTLGRWEDVPCETPDGRTNIWSKLRCTGQQEFYYLDANGQGDFREMDGTMEFYFSGQVFPNHTVLIGWRMPTSIEQHVGLTQSWGPVVAGSAVAR